MTLIIHWLRPPLFLSWCFETVLAIWSERLAKDPYQENTPPAVRVEPAIHQLPYYVNPSHPTTWLLWYSRITTDVWHSFIHAQLIYTCVVL